jgi:hypothetical protein
MDLAYQHKMRSGTGCLERGTMTKRLSWMVNEWAGRFPYKYFISITAERKEPRE